MPRNLQIQVTPDIAGQADKLLTYISNYLNIPAEKIYHIKIIKRSIDARRKKVVVNLNLEIYINENYKPHTDSNITYQNVANASHVLIIGAGPAGLFAALKLIERGLKPIIIERGKDVRGRRRDLAKLNKDHIVNPESNYCFGEGGAGTYSDGKLYTRSKKRGDVTKILDVLIAHGASENIKIDAHPHIGTNKLPQIITAIRETILKCGGKILFNTKVVDLIIKNHAIKGVVSEAGERIFSNQIILATGHSARDIFKLLEQKLIAIEAKPFALGVRVEHPQKLIDKIQYHCSAVRNEYLPPAPYNFARQINGRGVYSFCMCPGGIIAPCATEPNEVVTNGWSPSKRDQATANSGIVVELNLEDFKEFSDKGALAGMYFQKSIEHKAWEAAGKSQAVPAQRLVDFVKGKLSNELPKTSYVPGIVSVNLKEILPSFIYEALQQGFIEFGNLMDGYLTNEAVVHAPESRTSSPVRIPRDKITLQHPDVKGLYPCGEGAGYAGGIMSAAIDGEKCADQCYLFLENRN